MSPVELIGVELSCTNLSASADFFGESIGLVPDARNGASRSFRCVGEDLQASLTIRQGTRSGLDRLILRAAPGEAGRALPAPSALGSFEIAVTASPPAAPEHPGERTVLNQPTPLRGIGVEPRRLAHVGLVVPDVDSAAEQLVEELSFTVREVVTDHDGTFIKTLAVSAQALDVMLLRGRPDGDLRLHHVAFAVDQRDSIARAALLFAERAVRVEVGLGQHGIAQMSYLYCIEPSGVRVALVHSPIVIHDPEHPAVTWPPEAWDRALMLWGAPAPPSFFDNES
jgi:hypothetical protein